MDQYCCIAYQRLDLWARCFEQICSHVSFFSLPRWSKNVIYIECWYATNKNRNQFHAPCARAYVLLFLLFELSPSSFRTYSWLTSIWCIHRRVRSNYKYLSSSTYLLYHSHVIIVNYKDDKIEWIPPIYPISFPNDRLLIDNFIWDF